MYWSQTVKEWKGASYEEKTLNERRRRLYDQVQAFIDILVAQYNDPSLL